MVCWKGNKYPKQEMLHTPNPLCYFLKNKNEVLKHSNDFQHILIGYAADSMTTLIIALLVTLVHDQVVRCVRYMLVTHSFIRPPLRKGLHSSMMVLQSSTTMSVSS